MWGVEDNLSPSIRRLSGSGPTPGLRQHYGALVYVGQGSIGKDEGRVLLIRSTSNNKATSSSSSLTLVTAGRPYGGRMGGRIGARMCQEAFDSWRRSSSSSERQA